MEFSDGNNLSYADPSHMPSPSPESYAPDPPPHQKQSKEESQASSRLGANLAVSFGHGLTDTYAVTSSLQGGISGGIDYVVEYQNQSKIKIGPAVRLNYFPLYTNSYESNVQDLDYSEMLEDKVYYQGDLTRTYTRIHPFNAGLRFEADIYLRPDPTLGQQYWAPSVFVTGGIVQALDVSYSKYAGNSCPEDEWHCGYDVEFYEEHTTEEAFGVNIAAYPLAYRWGPLMAFAGGTMMLNSLYEPFRANPTPIFNFDLGFGASL